MLYIAAIAVVLVIIVYVGTFLNRQAATRGPRRNTDHLRKIRTKVRGGRRQDRPRKKRRS